MKHFILPILTLLLLSSCWSSTSSNTEEENSQATTDEAVTEDSYQAEASQDERQYMQPNGLTLTDIENTLKSAEDISTILNFNCETSLYPWYTSWDDTSSLDYSIITACYNLITQYERNYYETFIQKDPTQEYPIPESFRDEYELYKSNIQPYNEYIKIFETNQEDINTAQEAINTADCDNTAWTDWDSCTQLSEQEYNETLWKAMSYEDFAEMQKNSILFQQETLQRQIERYREILMSME